MQLDVFNIEGEKTGRSVNLSDQIFGIKPNDHLIYMAVKHYRAGKHRGTHKTKGRSEVKGSTRKLHRQKGTGGSRKGDIKNPLYHGGGTVFGPQPHGYGFKMNKKEKDLAKLSALSYKLSGNAIKVVENLSLDAPKTKTLKSALQRLEVDGRKVLYVTATHEKNLSLSLRNLSKVNNITLGNINTYDIVNSNFLLLSEDAAKILANDEGVEEKTEERREIKTGKKETDKEVKEATAEVKEADEEVKEAKAEVKEADEEVKEAKEEVKEAKAETKEAEEVKEAKEETDNKKEEDH